MTARMRSMALVAVALAAAAVAAAGCMTVHDILLGSSWHLIEIQGEAPAAEATLTFDAGQRYGGTPGCNQVGGGYHLEGNVIVLERGTISAKECGAEAMRQEAAFMEVLGGRPTYAIDTGTGHLRLTSPDGAVLLFEAR